MMDFPWDMMHPWWTSLKYKGCAQDSGLSHTHSFIPPGLTCLKTNLTRELRFCVLLLLIKADMTSDSRVGGISCSNSPCASCGTTCSSASTIGGLIQQLFNPRCRDKAHHNGTCRTRARLISWGIHDPPLMNYFPVAPPLPIVPFKVYISVYFFFEYCVLLWISRDLYPATTITWVIRFMHCIPDQYHLYVILNQGDILVFFIQCLQWHF